MWCSSAVRLPGGWAGREACARPRAHTLDLGRAIADNDVADEDAGLQRNPGRWKLTGGKKVVLEELCYSTCASALQ